MSQAVEFRGSSMYPLIPEHSTMDITFFSEPVELQKIEYGQVVVLRENDEWVAHRVVHFRGTKVSKGDWTLPIDSPSLAWGIVTRVNDHPQVLLQSSFLAQCSENLLAQNSKWRRKVIRVVMLIYVFLRKERS